MNAAAPILLIGEGLMTVNRPADAPPPAWGHCWMGTAGAEMNVAIGLARLGHVAHWATTLGDDPLGDAVLAAARSAGVTVSAERRSERTGMIVKIARADDEPDVRYYRDGSAFAIAPPQADPTGARVLYLSGVTPALSPACRAAAMQVVERAAAAGVPLWFDLNMRRRLWSEAEAKPVLEWFCARADTVLAADDEAAIVVGAGEPLAQAQRLRDLGARQVVLKAASIGALCHDAMESVSVPRLANVTVRDPIGAGDAFAAGFLSARLDGLSAAAALQRGHVCAAAVCRTLGDWEGFPLRRDLARQAGGASR